MLGQETSSMIWNPKEFWFLLVESLFRNQHLWTGCAHCYTLINASADRTRIYMSLFLYQSTYMCMKNYWIYTKPAITTQYQGYILVFSFNKFMTFFPKSEKTTLHNPHFFFIYSCLVYRDHCFWIASPHYCNNTNLLTRVQYWFTIIFR